MKREVRFTKMEGAGNDYVYVDAELNALTIEEAARLAEPLADRHFGVGGDGLILLCPSERADARMVMWNADGSRGAMCGNGLRCLARFAWDRNVVRKESMTIETDSGLLDVRLQLDEDGSPFGASIEMSGASIDAMDETADLGDLGTWTFRRGTAGNPHAVVLVDDVESAPVEAVGTAFQALPTYPDGVNVEFVHQLDAVTIAQRTWERGSGETLACGTGATVVALFARAAGLVNADRVAVQLRGGTLHFHFGDDVPVLMTGPATTVFDGVVTVDL